MKKAKQAFYWFLANGAFAAGMYLAYFKGIKNAESVVIFYTWALAIISLAYTSDDVIQKIRERGGRSVPAPIDVTFDIAVITTFVWFGAIATGAAYLVYTLLHNAAFTKAAREI